MIPICVQDLAAATIKLSSLPKGEGREQQELVISAYQVGESKPFVELKVPMADIKEVIDWQRNVPRSNPSTIKGRIVRCSMDTDGQSRLKLSSREG